MLAYVTGLWRRRLATRTTNSYGKARPDELEGILAGSATFENAYRRFGAQPIDAGRPVGDVVDEMLSVREVALVRSAPDSFRGAPAKSSVPPTMRGRRAESRIGPQPESKEGQQ